MFEFFRKYQAYFFAVIAFVIIISFSFFGTYNTLPSSSIHEQVAFTAVNGSPVKRSEVEQMAMFIGSDNEDKWLSGGAWGPNFLNNGVIKNDFLATGLAKELIAAYPNDIAKELDARLTKERRYALYAHPQAKFVSVEGLWAYFMPHMKSNFDALRHSSSGIASESLDARIALFLGERQFPAPMLRHVLNNQQKQYGWLTPDPALEYTDLSLFGYHTTEDWFGPHFVRLVAEFIMNGSIIAEKKGYTVSKEEVLSELYRNAEISYQQNLRNANLGVANSSEYFNEQLRRLGMDQTNAVKVWRQVMLFRRLFQDVGSAVLIDPLLHQTFLAYAKEQVNGNLYRVPAGLRINDFKTLQKLEAYLDAVARRDKGNLLALPTAFLSAKEVKRTTPSLVQKHYVLEVAQASKTDLQTKVGLKEMWNWEVANGNWEKLIAQFPILGQKKASTRTERLNALDNLDDPTRGKVDAYALAAIVEAHPEWLKQALKETEPQKMPIGISTSGGNFPLKGLSDRTALISLLDQAPLAGKEGTSNEEIEAAKALAYFTGDNINFYNITVLERSSNDEILTFAEANQAGILDQLVNTQLENYYTQNRESHSAEFKKEDGSWKPLSEVRDQIAKLYYDKTLQAIRENYTESNKELKNQTDDRIASLRLYSYVKGIEKKLQQGTVDTTQWVRTESDSESKNPLRDQWKILKNEYKAERSTNSPDLDIAELFALAPNAWTAVHTPLNGDLYFFHLEHKAVPPEAAIAYDQLHEAHGILSDASERTYTHRVLQLLKEKQAISLDYLNNNRDEESIGPGA